MAKERKEIQHKAQTLMIEPSDEILRLNEAIYGDDFSFLEEQIKENGPYVTLEINELPSLLGKKLNVEKRLTVPTSYEPTLPYYFPQSGLSSTFTSTPADLHRVLVTH